MADLTPRLVLVGPPGAGKTLVGRRVAERLQVAFRDTDHDIIRTTGKPISEIFTEDGEERFRELERRMVATALEEHDGVLSLGGGAVLSQRTRTRLAGLPVVLLDVNLSLAAKRIGLDRDRPLLTPNPRATLRLLLEQRMPLYREVASSVVDTNHKPPEAVVDEVLALTTTP